jgi:hypothetical protein
VKRHPISNERRLEIFIRDDLTCLFCGERPGRKHLNVAHIIPHSRQGSDHENNLVTSCRGCNAAVGNRIAVPSSMCESSEPDRLGWITWRRWGSWVLQYLPDADWPPVKQSVFEKLADGDNTCHIALTFEPLDYWISLDRIHEGDWHSHLRHKTWMRRDREDPDHFYRPDNWPNFERAIGFCRTLMRTSK